MRYTVSNGIEDEGPSRRLLVSIPIVAALLLLVGAVAKHSPTPTPIAVGKPHPISVKTLGITTSATNPSDVGGQGGGTPELGSATTAGGGLQPARSSTGGGGVGSAAPSPSPSPSGGSGGGGSGGGPSTVSCFDLITQTQQVCNFPFQACTLPAGVTVVGKPVLTTSGTCIVIN